MRRPGRVRAERGARKLVRPRGRRGVEVPARQPGRVQTPQQAGEPAQRPRPVAGVAGRQVGADRPDRCAAEAHPGAGRRPRLGRLGALVPPRRVNLPLLDGDDGQPRQQGVTVAQDRGSAAELQRRDEHPVVTQPFAHLGELGRVAPRFTHLDQRHRVRRGLANECLYRRVVRRAGVVPPRMNVPVQHPQLPRVPPLAHPGSLAVTCRWIPGAFQSYRGSAVSTVHAVNSAYAVWPTSLGGQP